MNWNLDTLFGSMKEFSSFKLVDVSWVFVDPDNFMEFGPNPSTETLRLTELLPRFTTCKIILAWA